MARGMSRCGTFASSTTFAKSSNPTNAKNASRLANAMPDRVVASVAAAVRAEQDGSRRGSRRR